MQNQTSKTPTSFEVIEVDAEGRPLLVKTRDLVSGEWGWIEMQAGYRPKATVQSDYDPFARGLGKEDER